MKQEGLAHFERAMQHVRGSREGPEANRNLSECGQRDGESVSWRILLVQRYATLGQMERLLVAVTDHRDVRLIAAGDRHHIIGTAAVARRSA